ncbi:tRNA pseudouridine(55) synthase TruB [Hydrogenobacter sp. T-2]|uniref:tRNA pseudouridine(55) synthase TruB n=1 Tax=Pampinifervens diazotrophicum TaxID=1632018 RepID=UPI002B25D7C1|nr:tRNA pseudouridine(55) synthase TruB [Hydrogenobacter sp. T-2]WPM32003.1 tRNA pseudouridine(55) synthase TruB [Hydrogenobacter sp. T-2]
MVSGLLLVDKPKGPTSAEVLEGIKRRFKVKVGHAGTLDPIATGLLIVLVGEGTKFSQFFTGLDKAYRTMAKLGEITDTYDAEGDIIQSRPVEVSCQDIEAVLKTFTGKLLQKPPPFSAKRIGGKRAYELARKGLKVDIKPVEIHVYKAELLECKLPFVELLFEVSSGTYIRSLIHDLGLKLSCGAHVVELRRLRIGGFNVEMAISYNRLLSLEDPSGLLIPVGEALSFMPKITLEGGLSRRIKHGSAIRLKENLEKTFVRLYEGDTFIGVGLIEGNTLRPYRLMQGL